MIIEKCCRCQVNPATLHCFLCKRGFCEDCANFTHGLCSDCFKKQGKKTPQRNRSDIDNLDLFE